MKHRCIIKCDKFVYLRVGDDIGCLLGSGLVSCILSDCYVIKQHGKASQDRI